MIEQDDEWIKYHDDGGLEHGTFRDVNGVSPTVMDIFVTKGGDTFYAEHRLDQLRDFEKFYLDGAAGRVPHGFRHQALRLALAKRRLLE